MDCSIFRAYDIRGRYPAELNERVVRRIVNAYCVFLAPQTVVLGRDVRESGPSLHAAARESFVASGVDVIDLGVVPVDLCYYGSATLSVDGGLFISASHNPREWNGLNFMRRGAAPISGDSGLKEIQKLAVDRARPAAPRKGTARSEDVTGRYFDFIASRSGVGHLRPIKAVINGNFGVSAELFRRFVTERRLPLTLVGLNETPDGTFPKGPPNPLLPENRKEMSAFVVAERADLGIAWDADGDRCFFFDEGGRFIEGYFITAILAGEMLRRDPGGTILTDPRLIWAVEDAVTAMSGKLVITRPGMTLIAERMKKEGAVFAGEMSSHFYFRDTFNRDNGFLPALMMLELMSRERKKLSEIAAPYTSRYVISGEINFSARNSASILERVAAAYRGGMVSRVDGISVAYPEWRFNLRMSNTEPLVRLNVEARSKEILDRELTTMEKFISSHVN